MHFLGNTNYKVNFGDFIDGRKGCWKAIICQKGSKEISYIHIDILLSTIDCNIGYWIFRHRLVTIYIVKPIYTYVPDPVFWTCCKNIYNKYVQPLFMLQKVSARTLSSNLLNFTGVQTFLRNCRLCAPVQTWKKLWFWIPRSSCKFDRFEEHSGSLNAL